MSDTQKLILWVVLAVVIIAIVAWVLVRSSRKRQEEAQRRQASSLRAEAAARDADVTRATDRASVTHEVAAEARADADESHVRAQQAIKEARARAAEAEHKAVQAERLDREADAHRSAAQRVQSERDDLLREADRVDPDVVTDEQSHPEPEPEAAETNRRGWAEAADERRDEESEPVSTGARGISAPAFDDDEPDLADAENPFASHHRGGADSEHSGGPGRYERPGEPTDSPRRPAPADPHDRPAGHVFASHPEFGDPTGSGHDTSVHEDEEPEPRDVVADRSAEPGDPVAAAAAGGGRSGAAAQGASVSEIIGQIPEESPAMTVEQDEAVHGDQESEEEQDNVQRAGSEPSTTRRDDASTRSDPGGSTAPGGARRVSRLEEVRDGGYGVGSAAPLADGAQPLGHPVKGVHDRQLYLAPGAPGYGDVEPDVWFYDERAARRAGYRPAPGTDPFTVDR